MFIFKDIEALIQQDITFIMHAADGYQTMIHQVLIDLITDILTNIF
jgi:hypothetical protein